MSPLSLLLSLLLPLVAAQQYAGDVISAYLPTIPGAEVAFFKIPDPTGANNNLTLVNYYARASNGGRIRESNIQRAVIVVHGLLRDPWAYEQDIMNALAKVTDPTINKDSVAMIAPMFPNGNDKSFAYPWTDGLSPGRGSTSNALVWKSSEWSAGANNQYPYNSKGTSSFFVLDTLVKYFDDAALFPNLKQIVLVGHSLGGQMLQRYAAVGNQLNTRVPVTYWIGNPNSYTWLVPERPLVTANCPGYDDYRMGLANYEAYPMTYGKDLVAQGPAAVLANYRTRSIAYARALYDHGDHSNGCSEFTEGIDRYERFFFFIKRFRPRCPSPNTVGAKCDTVDLVLTGHDNGQMFGSDAGLARLFTDNFRGDGARAYDFGYPRKQYLDDPYPNPALSGTSGTSNYRTYAGGMTYQGCWTDQQRRGETASLLSNWSYNDGNNLTIAACASRCNTNGFTVAGVQRGFECWCGNNMRAASAVLTVDLMCYYPCPGDRKEMCGGPDRVGIVSKGFPAIV